MREALYRKYRSRGLDEVVGQDHITDVLRVVIRDSKPAHAYLFTGPRGVGKTSIARILAHEFNELPYEKDSLDIIEVDAASHGGVDDARDLRDKAIITPSELKYKVYIIDEVHMLSRQAFDALLKLIEEPPEHTIFIMATTEVDKVPATIKSRAHQYHLRLASHETIAEHLKKIADQEKFEYEQEALSLIAELGQGSFRDAISLLDQVSGEKITRESVERVFGLTTGQQIDDILKAVNNQNTVKLYEILQGIRIQGVSSASLAEQIIRHLEKLAPEHPQYFGLIDKLLEVRKSTDPNQKLMVVLAGWNVNDTTATSSRKKFVKQEDMMDKLKKPKSATHTGKEPKPEYKYKVVEAKVETEGAEEPVIKSEPKPPKIHHQINWVDIVDEIAKTNPMVATNLRKSEHAFDGEKLTITPATKLAYKTTNSTKNHKLIVDTVREGYGFTPVVEIIEV